MTPHTHHHIIHVLAVISGSAQRAVLLHTLWTHDDVFCANAAVSTGRQDVRWLGRFLVFIVSYIILHGVGWLFVPPFRPRGRALIRPLPEIKVLFGSVVAVGFPRLPWWPNILEAFNEIIFRHNNKPESWPIIGVASTIEMVYTRFIHEQCVQRLFWVAINSIIER